MDGLFIKVKGCPQARWCYLAGYLCRSEVQSMII